MTDATSSTVDTAVDAMRNGDDDAVAEAIYDLLVLPPAAVMEELAERVTSGLMMGSLGLAVSPQVDPPLGRIPNDETFAELAKHLSEADMDGVRSLTDGSYEDLIFLLLGVLARHSDQPSD